MRSFFAGIGIIVCLFLLIAGIFCFFISSEAHAAGLLGVGELMNLSTGTAAPPATARILTESSSAISTEAGSALEIE